VAKIFDIRGRFAVALTTERKGPLSLLETEQARLVRAIAASTPPPPRTRPMVQLPPSQRAARHESAQRYRRLTTSDEPSAARAKLRPGADLEPSDGLCVQPLAESQRSPRIGGPRWWRHSKIGEAAGAKVNTDPRAGKVKFASSHDLRRSFGERWAPRVMPQVLRELMRDESIDTTLRFFVGRKCQATADMLGKSNQSRRETTAGRALQRSRASIGTKFKLLDDMAGDTRQKRATTGTFPAMGS
jgi:hypothetical protein